MPITNCKHCGAYIDTSLGADSPGTHQGQDGTKSKPFAPGDWDDICEPCNYGLELRGGPVTVPTYQGDGSEWRDQ